MNYDKFHAAPRLQKKIIDRNNFTYRYLIDIFEELDLKTNSKILDYGSGVGTIDFYLASKKFMVDGLEVSKNALQISKRSAKAIGVEDNAKFFNISKKINTKYDVIICSEVIEHIFDYHSLLTRLKGYLKKGGYLLVTTPSLNAPLFKMRLLTKFDSEVGHLRRYNVRQLRKEIEKMGFKIIFVHKKEGILRNSLFTLGKLNWMVKFLKGPLSDWITYLDELLVKLFGESNIHILSQKP
ncbi:MAG: class I SAM-dependent methyltransferase [Patescibacteria group bacterium]